MFFIHLPAFTPRCSHHSEDRLRPSEGHPTAWSKFGAHTRKTSGHTGLYIDSIDLCVVGRDFRTKTLRMISVATGSLKIRNTCSTSNISRSRLPATPTPCAYTRSGNTAGMSGVGILSASPMSRYLIPVIGSGWFYPDGFKSGFVYIVPGCMFTHKTGN